MPLPEIAAIVNLSLSFMPRAPNRYGCYYYYYYYYYYYFFVARWDTHWMAVPSHALVVRQIH